MRLKTTPSVTPISSQPGPAGLNLSVPTRRIRRAGGITIMEVVMSTAVVAMVFGGVIRAYIQAGVRIEWTGYSLAAQQMASAVVEQAKAATWDPTRSTGPQNDLTNMSLMGASYTNLTYSGYLTNILDIPYSRTNGVMATNFVTIQMLYLAGNVNIPAQFVRVDTVWPFRLHGNNSYFTNTVCTMVAPDNASNGSF